jgi:electron transport complex protein RnfA
MEYLLLFGSTVLVNNIVLAKFLGLCPLMGVSSNLSSAFGMGMATTFVLTLSALCGWAIETWLLVPLHIEFLRILSFILIIAAIVQFTELMVRKSSPALYKSLGIFLPLITTNCAVLGVALLNVREQHGLLQSLVYGFGSAVGFTLILVIFAGLRERLAMADVPATFAGAPVGLVTAGILSLVFMGFGGML